MKTPPSFDYYFENSLKGPAECQKQEIRAMAERRCRRSESAKVIMDRHTGRSKGFGFVEMATDAEAVTAIEKLNGAEYEGRTITVNEAREMQPREGGGGGRGPRGPGGGGGYRGNREGGGGGGGGGYRGNREGGGNRGPRGGDGGGRY